MEWYIRFINGLPPRKNSDDLQNFYHTFPEARHKRFCPSPSLPLFFNISKHQLEDFLDQWQKLEIYPSETKTCLFKFCANNPKLNKDGNYLELVRLPPKKNETEEDKLSSFLQDLKKLTGEIQATKILYFDSYFTRSLYEANSTTNKILAKIKNGYNLKEIELRGPDGWYVKPKWTPKSSDEINSKLESSLNATFIATGDNFHDRYILFFNKGGDPISGISIGTSINSLFNNKSYFLLRFDEEDIKTIINQCQNT